MVRTVFINSLSNFASQIAYNTTLFIEPLESGTIDRVLVYDSEAESNWIRVKLVTFVILNLGTVQKNNPNDDENDYSIDLTSNELEPIGYVGSFYTLIDNETSIYKTDKKYFMIKEVLDNLLDFETDNRPSTTWENQIDCHLTFYEGSYLNKKGYNYYEIAWDSKKK